jgi:hypothetical protein
MKVQIREHLFDSVPEAAAFFNVHRTYIYRMLDQGMADKIGIAVRGKPPHSLPVTIRGVEYPSMAAAARAFRLSVDTVDRARKRGTLDRVGLGPGRPLKHPPQPPKQQVTIRGEVFPNLKAAAKALGCPKHQAYRLRKEGRLQEVGLPIKRKWKGVKPPSTLGKRYKSKETTINGVTYPSQREAARALGFSLSHISKMISLGRLHRVGTRTKPGMHTDPGPGDIQGS